MIKGPDNQITKYKVIQDLPDHSDTIISDNTGIIEASTSKRNLSGGHVDHVVTKYRIVQEGLPESSEIVVSQRGSTITHDDHKENVAKEGYVTSFNDLREKQLKDINSRILRQNSIKEERHESTKLINQEQQGFRSEFKEERHSFSQGTSKENRLKEVKQSEGQNQHRSEFKQERYSFDQGTAREHQDFKKEQQILQKIKSKESSQSIDQHQEQQGYKSEFKEERHSFIQGSTRDFKDTVKEERQALQQVKFKEGKQSIDQEQQGFRSEIKEERHSFDQRDTKEVKDFKAKIQEERQEKSEFKEERHGFHKESTRNHQDVKQSKQESSRLINEEQQDFRGRIKEEQDLHQTSTKELAKLTNQDLKSEFKENHQESTKEHQHQENINAKFKESTKEERLIMQHDDNKHQHFNDELVVTDNFLKVETRQQTDDEMQGRYVRFSEWQGPAVGKPNDTPGKCVLISLVLLMDQKVSEQSISF